MLFLAFSLTFPLSGMAQHEIEWLVAPYGWLPDIGLEQTGGDPGDGNGGGISGSSLLDKTDAAGMIRIEAAKNRWGVTLDYIFLDLSDSTVIETPGPVVPAIDVRADLDLTVVELGAIYRPSGTEHGVHYLFGYRGIDARKTLLITPDGAPTQRFDSDPGLADVFVGARYLHRFNRSWDVAVRGDYSFGESEGVVNLLASVGLRLTDTFTLRGGYRHVVLEYEEQQEGVRVNTEIDLSGSFIGFAFRF